jgi:hypothetical protein
LNSPASRADSANSSHEAEPVAIRITFHPLIDEPGDQGPSGRRRYKRADGVNVGLIRVDGEDAYPSEARRYAVNDSTVSLMRSDAEATSVPTTLRMSPHSRSGSRRKPLGAM